MKITELDTDLFPKGKKGLQHIGGMAAACLACIALFQFLVPSKAEFEQQKNDVTQLKQTVANDHDAITKLSSDVEYIRHWVEEQPRGDQP